MSDLTAEQTMRRIDPIRHQEKRQQILTAATECFVRDGFRGASTSDICKAAGISPGHLYHYFESKEAIINAMAAAWLEEVSARVSTLSERTDAIADLLLEIAFSFAPARRGAGQPILLEVLAEASRNSAMAKILHLHTRRVRALLASVLRKGQALRQIDRNLDPELTALLLIGILDSSQISLVRDPKLNVKKSVKAFKELIVRFLSPAC